MFFYKTYSDFTEPGMLARAFSESDRSSICLCLSRSERKRRRESEIWLISMVSPFLKKYFWILINFQMSKKYSIFLDYFSAVKAPRLQAKHRIDEVAFCRQMKTCLYYSIYQCCCFHFLKLHNKEKLSVALNFANFLSQKTTILYIIFSSTEV